MSSAEMSLRDAARREGRWTRIPLIGDPQGVVLLLPDEPLSPENWEHLLSVLIAMRPGLVADVPPVRPSTEETTTA